MPASGPASYDVDAEKSPTIPYALVKLTPETVSIISRFEPRGLAGAFPDKYVPPSKIKFGIGDVVSVTIFEASAGGLFIPSEAGVRPGNFVTIPDQTIDNDGNISVPYAGLIKAAGRFNGEIQQDIVNRIKNRAIEPQVVVSLSQQRTSLVSVFGEVNTPNRFPAAAFGAQDRITDAITRAGGIRGQGYETWVMLQRGNRRATVPFANLVYEASNNIYVQPNDRIYVYREQQKFLAFGATGLQGQFNFDAWRINLAEAVGKAGGLVDVQADPGSVYLSARTSGARPAVGRRCEQVPRRARAGYLQHKLQGSGWLFPVDQLPDAEFGRPVCRQFGLGGCYQVPRLPQRLPRHRQQCGGHGGQR